MAPTMAALRFPEIVRLEKRSKFIGMEAPRGSSSICLSPGMVTTSLFSVGLNQSCPWFTWIMEQVERIVDICSP